MPSETISGAPPTFVATTGNPVASASSMAFDKPSVAEGRTKRSAACR